jgi:hypothetical protein
VFKSLHDPGSLTDTLKMAVKRVFPAQN